MKRDHQRAFDETNTTTTTPQCKIAKLEHSYLFSSDVLGVVSSFLPFRDGILNALHVNHQWKNAFEADYRFFLCKTMVNYLEKHVTGNDDLEESETRLLVSIQQWIKAREHLIELLNEPTCNEKEDYLKMLWLRGFIGNEFPNIKFLAFDRVSVGDGDNADEYVVLMIHLNINVRLKMTIVHSTWEDYIIYVDVVEGDLFDWEKLNIDPKVKRNTVLKVNGSKFQDSSEYIEDYEINDPFFEALFNLFGKIENDIGYPSPFDTFLWKFDCEERTIGSEYTVIRDVEFERNCEIHDERLNLLKKQVNLEQINDLDVLKYVLLKLNKIYISKRENNLPLENSHDISISKVTGIFTITELYRSPRYCPKISFDLMYKNKKFHVKSDFFHEFEYAQIGKCRTSILDCTSHSNPQLKYQFYVFHLNNFLGGQIVFYPLWKRNLLLIWVSLILSNKTNKISK